MALRWGIVSAGKISHDFVNSLKVFPQDDHKVVAIGARALADAEKFAKLHRIPKACEGYFKIAQDPDVDIVYIGNLNPHHFEVSKLMLQSGKHVLCEKPLTMNEKQTREIIEFAKSKNLLLLDAICSRSFPAYLKLEEIIKSGIIGEVFHVNTIFGFNLEGVERLLSKELGGGTILDLGVYVLQFQQFVFRGLKPIRVLATGFLNKGGTDESASAIISYPGGKTALVSTSSRLQCPNEAVIVGTKGIIRVPEFSNATEIITPEKHYKFDLPKTGGTYYFNKGVGLCYEAEHARQLIKNGKIASPNITPEESIQLAQLMDSLRKQVGVVFPDD